MRKTIADLPRGAYDAGVAGLADRGVRRFHSFSFDFDSTASRLAEPQDYWVEE
jgi:hypothetical protein